MPRKKIISFLGVFMFMAAINSANAQCPNTNTLFGDITPTYSPNGSSWASINNVWGGDYYTVNVCAGATYTFTMCDNTLVTYDAEMTIRNDAGGALIAYNDDYCGLLPQITWEATFTGTVRVLIDEAVGCGHNSTNGMSVACYINSACGTATSPAGVVACNADVGTFTTTYNGNPVTAGTDVIYLCFNDATSCFSFTSNQDWTLPPAADNNPFETSEVMWAIYSCAPTGPDPTVDPCYTGLLWSGQDFSDCGNSVIPGIAGSQDLWYVPVTADDSDNGGDPNGVINIDQDGDGCFDIGTAFEIKYLNDILGSMSLNSCTGVATITLTGGSPEYTGSNYSSITLGGSGTLGGTPATHNGTVTVSGLQNGNSFSLTIADAEGCNKVLNFGPVTVDNTNPSVTCPGTQTLNLDASCQASLPDYTALAPVPTDGCGIASFTQSPAVGTVISGATTTVVTLTATDFVGNSSSCNFNVNTVDATNPTATCQNVSVNLDATGNASITAAMVNNGSSDNCGITSMSVSPSAFTCADLGANTVTLTVTDAAGNSSTCNATVTVNDNINPTATCQNVSVNLDASGNATVTAAMVNNGSSDNCGIASMTVSPSSFTCADIGANNVTLTVTDAAGNSSTCNATVTVADNTNPTAVCQNVSVNLDASGNATITAAMIDNGSSDNCGIASITVSPSSFTCANVGANNVTLTVNDVNGNSSTCNATVTVNDNTNPTAICQNASVNLDAAGNATITAAMIDNGSSDNCGVATVTVSPTAFTCADIGANTVTLTVTDVNGNTATCNATVTVVDPNVPTVNAGSNASICSADTYTLAAVLGGSASSGSWGSSGDGGFSSLTDPNAVYTPGPNDITNGTVTLTFTTDPSPCATVNSSIVLTIDPSPSFTVALGNHPTSCGATDGTIVISGLNGNTNYDISYDDGTGTVNLGTVMTDGAGNYVITGLGADGYSNFVVTLGPCSTTVNTPIGLSDPSAPTFTVGTPVDPTTCGGTDGSITISGLTPNTSYDITYDDGTGTVNLGTVMTDGAGNYVITGLGADTYTNFVVTITGCTGSDNTSFTLNDPAGPTFTVGTPVDPSTCGGTDGSITISGLTPNTSYDISYDDGTGTVNLGTVMTDGAGNYVITGLGADSYTNFDVIDGINCNTIDASSITLTDPSAPTFTVGTPVDPTTCGGTDGSITISGLTPNTSYDITYDDGTGTVNLGTVMTDGAGNYVITGLGADSYTNFVVTLTGCTGSDNTVITLVDPNAPTFTVGTPVDPTTCGGTDGSITISGLTPNTSYDITYDDGTGTVNLGTVMTDGAGNYVITGLGADSYTNFTVTLTGCTGSDNTVITLVDPNAPTFTVGTPVDPTTCGGTDGSITISGLTPNTSYDITYDDGTGTVNLGTVMTDGAGNYVITGLGADSYTNFTVTLTGCTGSDNTVITLVDPNAPTFTIATSDPTTCGGNDGTITLSGLTPSTSYDISYDDGSGTVNLGTVMTDAAGDYIITGLSAGSFTNFIVDLFGCVGTDNSTITLNDPPTPSAPAAGTDFTYCIGDPLADMFATPSLGGTIDWFSDAGLTTNIGTGNNLAPNNTTGTTVYYVTETAAGCQSAASTVTITIEQCVVLELEIPTGFTPDGDGVNDTWELVNLNALYPNNVVRVVNRWGNLLFESNGYATPWDGTRNGVQLPTGSYFFTIDFGDDSRNPESGSVTIIRN